MTVYAEPFAGSLAVLLASEPHRREIVCDTDGHIEMLTLTEEDFPEKEAFQGPRRKESCSLPRPRGHREERPFFPFSKAESAGHRPTTQRRVLMGAPTTVTSQCGCSTRVSSEGRTVGKWCKRHPYGEGSPLLAKLSRQRYPRPDVRGCDCDCLTRDTPKALCACGCHEV